MTSGTRATSADGLQQVEFAMEVAGIAWWEMDCATGAVRFHRRKAELLGYAPEGFTHYSDFTALVHPDDLEPSMEAMRQHLSGAQPEYRVEYRIRAKSGEHRWFEDVGRVSQRDEAGHPLTVTGVAIDVTDRRRAQEALHASEEQFRKLFHGHSAVKLVIDPATGGIVDANAAAARFYGWSIPELKRMFIQQINDLPPDAVRERMAAVTSAASLRSEFHHRRADGTIADVEVHSVSVEVAGRRLLYSIIHDISDRKRAELALKVSEQRFRWLAENVTDVLWVLDLEAGCYRYVSPSVVGLLGYSAEELMRRSMQESVTPASYASLMSLVPERVERFERGEALTYVDVIQQIRKDGVAVSVEVHSRFVRDAATGRLEALGVSRDITERLQDERALRGAHDRLRHAEAFARFGHWELSLDDGFTRASEGASRVYGLATAAPTPVVKACVLPQYRPVLDVALTALLERGEPYDQEFQIRRASDGVIVDVHSKAEYDPATRTVFGVVQDISDRKRIEAERESLIVELRQALDHVHTLSGIVPICAACKKIRDDKGYWEQVEAYVSKHTGAHFSHSICPECVDRLYPDVGL